MNIICCNCEHKKENDRLKREIKILIDNNKYLRDKLKEIKGK